MKARLTFSRISPQKMRLVADTVRGKDVNTALASLKLTNKKGARILERLLRSAIANAEQQNLVDLDVIYIDQLLVDEGTTIHRWRPRAQGRATPINKRTSHISMQLGVR